MKKLAMNISLISLIILISCSTKDDSLSETNSIIGAWKPIKEIHVCSNGIQQVYIYSTCEQTGRTIFFKNGTFSMTAYDITEGNCEQYNSIAGTWELNEGKLNIIANGQTNNPSISEFSGNKLQIGYDANPSNTCDGENFSSHYYTEFRKVE